MKNILDDLITGLVLGVLTLFGLRGVLPDIVADGRLPLLIGLGVAASCSYAIERHATATRCERNPELCRIT